MDKQLKLSEFDIVGLITLKDVEGIEEYVTQIGEEEPVKGKTEYLSRSKEYYNVKTITELSKTRESLKEKLTREFTKRNFVILENMLNCSAKAYFKKFEMSIYNPENEVLKTEMEQARKCMLEDTKNLIKILENKGLISVDRNLVLPEGRENSLRRFIEMDNKAVIYEFAKTFESLEDLDISKYELVIPGYGSTYLGPFMQTMYGLSYTNVLKSKYIKETSGNEEDLNIRDAVSDDNFIKQRKDVLLLDDNVGTGKTMKEIKASLKGVGIKKCISGAVQYNWRNYYRVSVGEKKDIERFNVNEFEILSPFNYAGHKLYEHAIDLLHESGETYIKYLKSKSYLKDEMCDTEGSIKRGLLCAKRTGLDLYETKLYEDKKIPQRNLNKAINYKGNSDRKICETAQIFINFLIENVNNTIDKDNKENIKTK